MSAADEILDGILNPQISEIESNQELLKSSAQKSGKSKKKKKSKDNPDTLFKIVVELEAKCRAADIYVPPIDELESRLYGERERARGRPGKQQRTGNGTGNTKAHKGR